MRGEWISGEQEWKGSPQEGCYRRLGEWGGVFGFQWRRSRGSVAELGAYFGALRQKSDTPEKRGRRGRKEIRGQVRGGGETGENRNDCHLEGFPRHCLRGLLGIWVPSPKSLCSNSHPKDSNLPLSSFGFRGIIESSGGKKKTLQGH